MKHKKSRKAQFFNIFMLIATAVILTVIYTTGDLKKEQFKEPIGAHAIEIAKMAQESEKVLLYVDSSAKLSAWQAARDLAAAGGISSGAEYPLWKEDKALNTFGPSDYKEEFLRKTKESLTQFLDYYKKQKEIKISKINTIYLSLSEGNNLIDYSLLSFNKSLAGSADSQMFVVGLRGGTLAGYDLVQGQTRRYVVNPSFNVDIGYDINEYLRLSDLSQELLDKCSEANNTFECINANLPSNWKIGACDEEFKPEENQKIFRFCVTSDYKLPYYDSKNIKFIIKPVQYKFALDFS
jgi:hypothetical protein